MNFNKKNNSKTKEILKLMLDENKLFTFIWITLSILIGFVPSITVMINKLLINEISYISQDNSSGHFSYAILLLLLTALIGIIQEIISSIAEYLYHYSKSSVSCKVEKKLYNTILKYPIEMFESSDMYNKIMMANQAIQMNCIDMIQHSVGIGTSIITLVSVFAVLLAISWYLPLALFIASIPSGIGIIVVKKYRYNLKKNLLELARKNGYLSFLFTKKNALKEIKVFNLSNYLINRWEVQRNELRFKELYIYAKEKKIMLIGKVIVQFSICFASVYLIKLISNEEITIGDYVSLLTATSLFQISLSSITENSASIYEMGMYIDALLDILHNKNDNESTEVGLHKEQKELKEIKNIILKNIYYKYPQSKNYILKNINLEINKGDNIAIVGYNGSGKSTLVNIIMGVYKNFEGNIFVNKDDISMYLNNSYFSKFSCVMQDFMKYDLTLRENIAFGNMDLINDDETILQYLRKVGLNSNLSKYIDEMLSVQYKGGIELSGGEWQKIAIARAMIRNAEIVVFDEPTASLDPVSEMKIFNQLNSLSNGKTRIIVSHRLGITKYCNKIIVMSDGEIVEIGTHEELLNKGGLYNHLYNIQASWYNDEQINMDD
jgi:putative ABC transport system ATP-binding protein/ATP-binding cassette subfamily B protein